MKQTKLFALLMSAVLLVGLTACGEKGGNSAGSSGAASSQTAEPAAYSIAALKGPTAMGLVKLMHDAEGGEDLANDYTFSLAASPDEVTPKLIQGDLDMACVPANLAAVLYQKTEGEIVTLAVNTLGVLYIVEKGNAVQSLSDLAGMTIVSAGKGASPEQALRYLLDKNGDSLGGNVTVDWKSEHSESVAALASGAATVALLPQPFVTVAQTKVEGLRVALDLNKEWDKLADDGSSLVTGVIVARKDVVEENPGAVEAFLKEYAASVDWVNGNVPEAAELIGSYGIVDAAVAEKALPACNIVCITGDEMKEKLSGYLSVLFEQDPQSVGGALPEDVFYFGA